MSTLADLWDACRRARAGDVGPTQVLADALLEHGDPLGEHLAVHASLGFSATFVTHIEAEAQRLMSGSHAPNDLLRHPNGRWAKRARHMSHCDIRDPSINVCRCPMREPPLYRQYRCVNGGSRFDENGNWIDGAWTFETIYTHGERDHEELRIDLQEEARRPRDYDLIIERAILYVDIPRNARAVIIADARHFCVIEMDRYLHDHGHLPSPYYLAYRLAQNFGAHEAAGRMLHLAEEHARGRIR